MPDTTLTIKAKDLTKQAFNAVQKSLDKTTDHFEKLAKESQQTSKGIIGSLNRLKGALQANQEGFQSIAIGAGMVAASTGLMTKSFISAAMQMEKMKMGLTAVMGSAKAMEIHFKDLEKVARLPGLGLPEAVQGSQRLQAVGVSAKEAARQLEAFGLGVARVGGGREELMRVVEQFSQMSAKGKILMDDLRPIRAIMPDINKAMQTAFGTRNIEQIREMGIEAEEFISKVTTELLKLPSVGNTAANSVENLTDTVFKLKAQLGKVLLPTVSKIIDTVSKLVVWFTNLSKTEKAVVAWGTAITAAGAAIVAAIAGIVLALPGLIAGVTTLATIVIPKLSAALIVLAHNPFVLATAAVVVLGLALGQLIKQFYVARKIAEIESQTVEVAADQYKKTAKKVETLRKEYVQLKLKERDLVAQHKELTQAEKERLASIEKRLKIAEKVMKKAGMPIGGLPTLPPLAAPVSLAKYEFKLREQEIQLIEDKYKREEELAILQHDKNVARIKDELEKVKGRAQEEALLKKQHFNEDVILMAALSDIKQKRGKEYTDAELERIKKANDTRWKQYHDFIEKAKQAETELQQLKSDNLNLTIALIEDEWIKRHALIQQEYSLQKIAIEKQLEDRTISVEKRMQLEIKLAQVAEITKREHAELEKQRDEKEAERKQIAHKAYLAGINATAKRKEEIDKRDEEFERKAIQRGLKRKEPRELKPPKDTITRDVITGWRQLIYEGDKITSDIDNITSRIKDSLAQNIATMPSDIINIFQERRQIERDAQEDILQLNRDTQDRIRDIQQNTTLSHIERLKQIEQAEKQSADRRKQIEEDLNRAKSQAFKGYVQSFLIGIAKMIQAEAQRQLASGISSMIGGGTFAAGAAAGPAGIAAMLAIGIGSQALAGGFDNPIHDTMARNTGRQIAMTYGTSFDNPTNDIRAKLSGTMSASQSLGERSASDMLSYFSKGFETQADAIKAGQSQGSDNVQLQGVLGKIEQRLSETPQFTFLLDGRELTAIIKKQSDKITARNSAY